MNRPKHWVNFLQRLPRGSKFTQHRQREVDVVVGDVGVHHEAGTTRRHGATGHSPLGELVDNLTGLRVREGHDVGLARGGVVARLGERCAEGLRQDLGAGVILDQPVNVIQGHESGRGQEAGLAHGAAQALAFDATALHKCRRAGQQ